MSTEKSSELKLWAIVLGVGLVLVVLGAIFAAPMLAGVADAVAPGIGIKEAAVWSFGITFAMFIVFAVTAGDGLIGEIQYMLIGFFLFFIINTVLIAWVF